MKWRAASVVLLAASTLSARQAPPAADFTELAALAQSELKEINAPGAAIAVVKGDRIVYQQGVGIANLETGQPVSADMLFRVGSVTKMFTTAALATLADEGKLKLAEPIGKYTSGVNGKLSRVTAHQLMSHTAGMKDEAPAYGTHDDSSLAVTVRGWGEDYLFVEPGRVMSYSNPGLTLAGFVLEQVAKKPYAEVIDERLFKPLGMTHSTFYPTVAMTWPLAQGHTVSAQVAPRLVRPFADNAGYWPAGFMFSSVTDLARFTIAFMNDGIIDGHSVLKPSVIVTLSTGYTDIPSNPEHARYAYGLTTAMHRGVRLVEHGGAIDGFGASVRMLPDQKAAVVTLVNRTGGQLEKTSERALELLTTLQPAAPRPTAPIAMDATEMAKYTGTYLNGANRIELLVRDGKLWLRQGAGERAATKVGDLRFAVEGPPGAPPLEFALVPGTDGQTAFLHIGSRALRKLPAPK